MEIYICADFAEDGIQTLRSLGHTVRTGGWGYTNVILGEDDLIRDIGDADILLVGYEPVTKRVLESTHLKMIFSIRGGPRANIDVDTATELGIPVFYTFGREALPVADFTIGVMIALARNIVCADSELHRGVFTAPAVEIGSEKDVIWDMDPIGPWQSRKGPEMEGKVIGLIGFGTVGRQVAQRAKGFDMDVLVYDPYQPAEAVAALGCRKVELDELLAAADVISCHAKITDSNKNMISYDQFAKMKQGVYLINTARAGLIDEQAMREALRSGKLGGLALDVFHTEPVKRDDEYFNYPNVILTPHIAGAGLDVIYLQTAMLVNDLMLYLAGGMPKAIVNPEVFKK